MKCTFTVSPSRFTRLIETVVDAAFCQKFTVSAAFSNFTMFENDDAIGVFDSAQTMGDHKHGTVFHRLVQSFLNQFLGNIIQCTGCLIEDQH